MKPSIKFRNKKTRHFRYSANLATNSRVNRIVHASLSCMGANELIKFLNGKIADSHEKNNNFTIDYLFRVVSNYTGIPMLDMQRKTRKREIVLARQLAHTLIKALTRHSLSTIGDSIGEKDHATVIYSIRTIAGFMECDYMFRKDYLSLFSRFNITVDDLVELARVKYTRRNLEKYYTES